jgi:hypothetical protein
MRRTLALTLLLGLSVPIADGDEKPKPSTLRPDKDSRLAKRPSAQTQKIGLLSYYPNVSGGFTFLDKGGIAFYALPFDASVADIEGMVNGQRWGTRIHIIGPSKLPRGYYTLYEAHMIRSGGDLWRDDDPIGHWCGDFPKEFRLSITSDDGETRLKLKSIVPVLEHAEHAP